MISELILVGRLIVAAVLGGLVGYERQHRSKTLGVAGIRTHLLVCLGSSLVMILSIGIYSEVEGHTNADPARLAAQVVSGIGFLGAGTILKEGLTIRGLTTAASLWVVAAIGLAVGSGYYLMAVTTASIAILALHVLPRIEGLYDVHPYETSIVIKSEDKPGQIGKIGSYLGSINVLILDIKIDSLPNKQILLTFLITCPNKRVIVDIVKKVSVIEGIISAHHANLSKNQ